MYLEDADGLKSIFHVDKIKNKYEGYETLKGWKVAFSVLRTYPENIRYKSPKTKAEVPDVVALIHVIYVHPKDSGAEGGSIIPIILHITPFSKYLSHHRDYDFADDLCPTKESVEASKSTPKPIPLESSREYVYNHDTNSLQTPKGDEVSGESILDKLFNEHCNTVHLIKGLKLRWKIGSRNLIVRIIDLKIQFLKWTLRVLFGRSLDPKDSFAGYLHTYQKDDMKLLKTDSLDIFGYRAGKNVIITYSALVITLYLFLALFNAKIHILANIAGNNLLAVCASVLFLWLLECPLPCLFLMVINLGIRIRLKLVLRQFKS